MIYNGLKDISSKFDTFLFDAYGVFWEGNGFYAGSRELMRELVQAGKTVVVVSNTTMLHDDIVEVYAKKNLLCGRDYQYFVSSGEVLHNDLLQKKLQFTHNANPKKYYVIGVCNTKAFAGTIYQNTATVEEADFVYCGVPYLLPEDVAEYPQFKDKYWPVALDEKGNVCLWDSETEIPFVKEIEKIVSMKLPILNANPDYTAKEGHKLKAGSEAVFVVRNGLIAEMFRQRGSEVLEYGKPHNNIYDYTFTMLQQNGVNVDLTRTCMVGDTVRTDIKGALNAKITPILCVETGVTAQNIHEGNSLENLCKKENIDIEQVMLIKSVGGK